MRITAHAQVAGIHVDLIVASTEEHGTSVTFDLTGTPVTRTDG